MLGRVIAAFLILILAQIPAGILHGMLMQSELWWLFTLFRYARLALFLALIGWSVFEMIRLLRRQWQFGFRITGFNENTGRIDVALDDAGYAGRLRQLNAAVAG